MTHDIGNMVGYAVAALFPQRVSRWVVMDAPLPGIGHWDDQLKSPKVWHFNFRGPDVERLVAGRERILLDRFYNELSANPSRIDEQTRDHYAALYARPHAIHNAFSGQFAAFAQDAIDNRQLAAAGKLKMPVLAIGGDHSYGLGLATEIGFAAADVRAAVIEDSGHWIMEEQPERAVTRSFHSSRANDCVVSERVVEVVRIAAFEENQRPAPAWRAPIAAWAATGPLGIHDVRARSQRPKTNSIV